MKVVDKHQFVAVAVVVVAHQTEMYLQWLLVVNNHQSLAVDNIDCNNFDTKHSTVHIAQVCTHNKLPCCHLVFSTKSINAFCTYIQTKQEHIPLPTVL